MMNLLRYGFAGLAVVGASVGLGVTPQSDARSFGAFLGQPQAPGDYPCFTNGNGAVTNVCSTTRRFCIALPVDSSSHTIEATVRAPDINHNISCFGQSTTRDALGVNFTGFRSPGVFGSAQILVLGTVNVPAAGGMYACCDLAPSATVHSFNYNN